MASSRTLRAPKKVTVAKVGHWYDYHLPYFSDGFNQLVFKTIPRKAREKVRYDHWRIADTWIDEMNMLVRDEYGSESI